MVITLENASERVRNEIINKKLDFKTVESVIKKIRSEGYIKFGLYRLFFLPFRTLKSFNNVIVGKPELKSERVLNVFIKRLLKGK